MALLYLVPRWFFGIDIFLELLFAFATLFVAVIAFRVYKYCSLRECELFGVAFSFISASYFVWPFLNAFFLSSAGNGLGAVQFQEYAVLGMFAFYAHAILFLVGLGTLAYVTLNLRGYRHYSLFVSLPLLVVLFSRQPSIAFFFVSAVLLVYIFIHYVAQYRRNKSGTGLAVMSAFALLLVARVGFLFSVFYQTPYVLGHLFEFMSYGLILLSLMKTLRK